MSSTETVKNKIVDAQDLFPTNKAITIENLVGWLDKLIETEEKLWQTTNSPTLRDGHYWRKTAFMDAKQGLTL